VADVRDSDFFGGRGVRVLWGKNVVHSAALAMRARGDVSPAGTNRHASERATDMIGNTADVPANADRGAVPTTDWLTSPAGRHGSPPSSTHRCSTFPTGFSPSSQ